MQCPPKQFSTDEHGLRTSLHPLTTSIPYPPRRKRRHMKQVLGTDEAIMMHSRALDTVSVALKHLPVATLDTLVHDRISRRVLTDSDRDALRAYRRVVDRVRATGHGDLIEDQLEGFLSAIKADRHFRLPWAA